MTNRLTDADYALLLSCIEGLHRCRKLADFPQHSVLELRKLVPARMVAYAELDYARNRGISVFDPPLAFAPPPQEEWMKASHDHPVLNYFMSTGDGQALKISDFLSEPDFHRLDVYRKVYERTGAEDQLGFGVQVAAKFVLGYAFDRGERSFTERDRQLLNLVRPHIIQTYVHLEELAGHEELQRDLQVALRENGLGVIVVDETREIVHATPGAFERLASYIPIPENGRSLPDKLERWAYREGDGAGNATFVISREPARLILRRVKQETRLLLLLSEENSAVASEKLARFKLTPREQETLRWISEGKTNSEIATILGISLSTAKQHVERVLAKLGVENRTAAAMALRSMGI